MQVNFKDKTTTELKAIAYDVLATVQQYQQLLTVINNEIAERDKSEKAKAEMKPVVLHEDSTNHETEKSPE